MSAAVIIPSQPIAQVAGTVVRRELTPFGWLVVAEGVILISSRWWPATALPEPAVMALGLALIAVVAVAWVAAPRACIGVRGRWVVAARIPVGEEVAVGAVLESTAGIPPCALFAYQPGSRRLREVARLRAHPAGLIRQAWIARFPRRGVVQLAALELRCSQPFGVVAVRTVLGAPQEVVVLPGLGRLRRQLRQRLDAWLADAAPTREPGADELDHLRPYRPGDGMRAIHWRASARHGHLLVASRHDAGSRRVALLLDTSGRTAAGGTLNGRSFESLVCAAATLADALVRRGCEVTVHGGFAPRGVAGDQQRLLEAFAVARSDGVSLNDLVPAVPMVVIITARADDLPAITPKPLVLTLDGIDAVLRLPRRLRSGVAHADEADVPERSES